MMSQQLESRNPNYEKRYWMRVWIVAVQVAKGWRMLPNSSRVAWSTTKELAVDLWQLFLNIVLPLTFFAAPLYLWMLEGDNKKKAAKRQKDCFGKSPGEGASK